MATATVKMLYCVRAATGVDSGVIQAIADAISALPSAILPSELAGGDMKATLDGVAQTIFAIDTAGADPDDLYVTTGTEGDVDLAVWPGNGETQDVSAGQSVQPNITIDFEYAQNLSLWDYDTVSSDDLLGSVTMLAEEAGQGEIAKLATSDVEGSAYYVTYEVN